MGTPIFGQLAWFAYELLRMIDEGQTASISDVCENIEHGTITQFIYTHCGFKNVNVTLESIADVNGVLARKYVSENEANKWGVDNNGLGLV